MFYKFETERLLKAALDQPQPTPALKAAVNAILDRTQHPDRYPRPVRVSAADNSQP